MHAAFVQEAAYQTRVLGDDPEPPAAFAEIQRKVGEVGHRSNVHPGIRHRDQQLSATEAEIVQQQQRVAALLPELLVAIDSHEAHIRAATVHFVRDVP